MQKMNLVYADDVNLKAPEVYYDYEVTKSHLVLKYKVTNTKVFGESYRPKDKPSFALWEMDVVEFFGRYKDNQTYYEFQVSPFGQYFELEIIEPRKKVNLEYKSGMSKKTKISKDNKSWTAEIKVPLSKLSNDKNDVKNEVPILGNFFACLGRPFERFYFSAFLPEDLKNKPNFHQPKYFEII